jgi:hypothetical protein
MGFFSGARRKIKKLIPKEVRPFIPYAAALIPGGMGLSAGLQSMGGSQFLKAALARGLTDDEASVKDIARAGIFAAAPTALDAGIQGLDSTKGLGKFLTTAGKGKDATSIAEKVSRFADPANEGLVGGMDAVKLAGSLGAVDAGIKAAELNEDALAKYNADLARQGINDKAGRRSAIRAIYSNTGTWDMDEVDNMLDTYGYRTGGRVGYADGGSIITLMDGTKVQIPEGSYNSSGSLKDRIYSSSRGDLLREEIIRGLSFAKGGRVGYEDGGTAREKYVHFQDMLETAQEGLASLENKNEVMPIRELRLKEGGSVDDELMERVKELQDEGLDFASAMAQAMKESQSSKKARGGIMDVNENINMNIPGVGNENIDVNSMESIRGQTAGPQWYYDRIQALEFEFGDELTDEEIAEIAYDSDKFYDKMGYDPAEYKKGGRVNRAGGGMMMASADMDIPIQDLAEDFEITFGRPAESIEELKDYYRKKYEFNGDTSSSENNGIGKMADMDYREFIYDASRDNFANDMFGKDYDDLTPEEAEEIDIIIEIELGKKQVAPERMMAAEGGLMNLGGREMDLRGGGFVPMGKAERADDVPARLSKNEFVMTADAVRAAGGGSVQKGADLMYDQMKQLESQA